MNGSVVLRVAHHKTPNIVLENPREKLPFQHDSQSEHIIITQTASADENPIVASDETLDGGGRSLHTTQKKHVEWLHVSRSSFSKK